MERKTKKPWLVLLVCCGLAASSVGCIANAVGVFFTPVSAALGVGRGTFVMQTTFTSIATSFTSLLVPKIFKQFNFKLVLLLSALAAGVSTFLMGFSTNMPQFYVLGIIRGISSCLFSFIPITMIINYWFREKTGLATSLVLSFSGIAGAVFSPVFASLIESVGWQKTYMIYGVIVFALCIPSIIYPFSMNPKDSMDMPYGNSSARAENTVSGGKKKKFKFAQMGIVIFFAFALLNTAIVGLVQHFPGFAGSIGYSSAIGAAAVSAIMIGNISTKLVIGIVSDRIGAVYAAVSMICVNFVSVIIVLTAPTSGAFLAGAFLFGSIYSVGSVGTPLLTKQFFGLENYSTVYPVLSFVTGLGGAVMSTLVGYVYDFTGSYYPSIASALVFDIVNVALIIFVGKKLTRKKPDAKEVEKVPANV